MATLYPEIKTKNWQLSTAGIGIVAEGLADIRQCLDVLLRTQKGTDPLRPQFGSDIFQFIDQPLNVAIPNIIKAITEAVTQWETRVRLAKVNYEVDKSKVSFFITYSLVDEELIDMLVLYLKGGFVEVDLGTKSQIVLNALYPYNPNNKRYRINFSVNDNTVLPQCPQDGFGTITDLYAWILANWAGYGRWEKLSDRIVLYMNDGIAQTGSLGIELIGSARFFGLIPNQEIGSSYQVAVTADGNPLSPAAPNFISMAEMLAWVQANWPDAGTWSIESNPAVGGDFDLSDFDLTDFFTGTDNVYLLVLVTDKVQDATITVTEV